MDSIYQNQELKEEYKKAFDQFDKDKQGTICRKELSEALKIFGSRIKEEEIDDFFLEVDLDQNGTIDFEEFLLLVAKDIQNSGSEEELSEALKMLDKKGDGTILTQDIFNLITIVGEKLPKEEAEELIREFDPEGTGIIHYQDLLRNKI